MSKIDIARALKDRDYFNSLTDDEKAKVRAANPVGSVDLSDDDLVSVSGGADTPAIESGSGTGSSALDASTCHCHCHCS